MKKLKVYLLMLLPLLGILSSCTFSNEDLILGKWKPISVLANGWEIPDSESNINELGDTWEFTSQGKLIVSKEGDLETMEYAVHDDKLTITEGDDILFATISKLNWTELQIDIARGNDVLSFVFVRK